MGNVYSGNIQVARLLKSNLPIKDSGDKWYLVREDADSNICEIYITDSNGHVIPVADSTARKQINDLNGKFTQPTITLYGGWVANDSVPFAVKVGTLLRVYARIKSGATASNTKIANIANISTQFPNQFFTIKDTLTGANLGQAYLTPNGDIYTLIELTANGDYLINESFIVLG